MPRLARLDAPVILHHVMGRCIERKEIFYNETDRNDFIERLTALSEEGALDDLAKMNLRLSGQRKDISALAEQVCKKYNISLNELCSGSRRRDVVRGRGAISWISVRKLDYSGADVALFLGVTNSCVTRFVASGQKPDVDDLISKL